MTKLRQQQQSEELRNRILLIAKRLISEKGIEGLSIRKIAKEMDYSPGIIYHYFKSKEEIIDCVLREGYMKILRAIKLPEPGLAPDESLRTSVNSYIETALTFPHEYSAIMLNTSPQVLGFTSVLSERSCEARPAMMAMVKTLESGVNSGLFAPCDLELTTQAIWSAIYGLLIRLIIEDNISIEQRRKLIDRQIEIILKGLKS